MNNIERRILVLAALSCPLMAIEPPVESQPIPPQQPPAAVPAPAELPRPEAVPAEEKVVPMPQVAAGRPFLGVILDPVPELLAGHLQLQPGEGVVVGDLVAGGPADKGGLKVGDVLLEVAGVGVGSAEAVRGEVDRHKVGEEVEVAFIQSGERRKAKLLLAEAPDEVAGPAGGVGGAAQPLDGFLEDLPDKHADLIREALERNLKAFENLDQPGGMADQLQKGLMQRLQREMGAGGMQMKFDIGAQSTIRLLDEQGSIEMTSRDGHKEAKVYDKAGELLWEGPYDTEQDKAAVPDGIRERLEKLNFDMDFKGNGMKLRLGGNRFRPLDQLDEDVPPPAPDDE